MSAPARTLWLFPISVLLAGDLACSSKATSPEPDAEVVEVDARPTVDARPPPPTCQERCKPFEACDWFPSAECLSLCAGSSPDGQVVNCLSRSRRCAEVTACLGLSQPFSSGPYGTLPFTTAAPFTLPTTEGDWSFEEHWSGYESHLFAIKSGGYSYADTLWKSSADNLLRDSPRNVHYFFLSYLDKDGVDRTKENIAAIKTSMESAIARLSVGDQQHWRSRVHFVTQPAEKLGSWIGEMLKGDGSFAFAIDRFQRVREVGMLTPPHSNDAQLSYLTHEARYYQFEWERERRLAKQPATTIKVFDGTDVGEGFSQDIFTTVTLPDAQTLAAFDALELDLTLGCAGHADEKCPPWDQGASLYLCDRSDPTKCDREIGRWITTYGREGRWVTDASQVLALLREGGERRVRFNTPQHYFVHLSIRLSRQGKGVVPSELRFLWDGGDFNEAYSSKHAPITFEVPAGTKRVELFALLTGHGWGIEAANCAEFCNHTHVFKVNGKAYVKDHPSAGSPNGCVARLAEGVVPNQYGTWPYGRGGWCPGLDVAPWVVDITDALVSGTNTVTYEGLFNGAPYKPQPAANPNPSGFAAMIWLSSYLALWR